MANIESPSRKAPLSAKVKHFLSSNRNSLLTIGGVLFGLLLGMAVKAIFWPPGVDGKEVTIDPYLLRYVSLPGILYIRVILLLIAPLLVSSLATSLLQTEDEDDESSEHQEHSSPAKSSSEINAKKLLITTLTFFVSFTLVAGLLGISLVVVFQPGVSSSSSSSSSSSPSSSLPSVRQMSTTTTNRSSLIEQAKRAIEQKNYKSDALNNLILNIFPDNLLTLLFMTSYVKTETTWPTDMSTLLEADFKPRLTQQTVQSFRPNMIGICSVSFLLGLLLKSMGPRRSAVMRALLREVDGLVGESFNHLLAFMPLGMFAWMFAEGLKMQSIGGVLSQLLLFYVLVTVGFAALWLAFYPAVVYLFTRRSAFATYRAVFPAMLIAFGTTSSAISLPMTMKCMEGSPVERLSKPIAQSVLPLGVTIHMNGSAVYYPMVALFVAQFKGLEVDLFMLVVLWIFTLAMTMGLPGSPNGGSTIITHIAFASAIGIDDPLDVLAFVMPMEWFWERVRTATNITGDCIVAKCIEQLTNNSSSQHKRIAEKLKQKNDQKEGEEDSAL